MRIVGGQFRGHRIAAPGGMATRPTTDRTRESVFNILAHGDGPPLEGARVIDLFAGSGGLGLEAMSRGAAFCLFVETAAAARAAIRENIEALGLTGATRLHRRSATSLGPKPRQMGTPFTLAFLDPPYGEGLVMPTLDGLVHGEWLADGAKLVVERGKADGLELPDGYRVDDERTFGDTVVAFLTRTDHGAD